MSALSNLLASNKNSDNSQTNKCRNEKRRREQENVYIEELAELISASISDMSTFSVKPDKCAILQETINQIKHIKQQEESTPREAVQQSRVSSSRPNILANDVLGPLLLEALDGFLIVVNSQGKVEFVSENVGQYLGYVTEDLIGKSIYNVIHIGDHAQFSSSVTPRSIVLPGSSSAGWSEAQNTRSRIFNCRMLKKAGGENGDESERSHNSQYETMQVSAINQPYPMDKDTETQEEGSTESQSCLVCIARRLPITEKNNSMLGIEQFTTKQDLTGKVVNYDTSTITPSHYSYPDFIGQNIRDFCHVNDVQQLAKHHQEVLKNGCSTSSVYRFKLQENRFVFVQTKSKLFNNAITAEPEYIMSLHSIIRECDSDHELKGSASTSLMKSIIGQTSTAHRGMLGISNISNIQSMNMKNFIGADLMSGMKLQLRKDEMNIDDVLDMLPSSTNWDMLTSADSFGLKNVNFSNSAQSSGSVTQTSAVHTPTTHISWSNMSQMNAPQVRTQGGMPQRPPALNVQNRSALSPGFPNQRSPGYAGSAQSGHSGQLSPGFVQSPNAVMSVKSPGFAAQSQRSPGFAGQNQWSPGAGFQQQQRSPGMAGQGRGQVRNLPPSFQQPQVPRNSSSASMMSPMSRSLSSQSDDVFSDQQVAPGSSGPVQMNSQMSQLKLQQLQQSGGGVSQVGANSQNPLAALQNMEAQAGNNVQMPNLSQAAREQFARDQFNRLSYNQRFKLRQLLQQNRESDIKETNDMPHSPAVSRQSPQPGPGRSPQEQPQSTSQDDPDDPMRRPEGDNIILKQLLSQDDEMEDKGDKSSDSDKNEAEPKRNENILLKQLLNDEPRAEGSHHEAKRPKRNELLQKLLQQVEDDEESKGNVESTTSQDGTPPPQKQDSNSNNQQRAPQGMNSSANNAAHSNSDFDAELDSFLTSASRSSANAEKIAQVLNSGGNLDLLSQFWDRDNNDSSDNRQLPMAQNVRSLKRKASSQDVDSTEMVEAESSTNHNAHHSQLVQNNMLLTQLLSKKDAVQKNNRVARASASLVDPMGCPQDSLPKNLDKIMIATSTVEDFKTSVKAENKSMKDVKKTPNSWDNPRTNPNSPFPGNTKDDVKEQKVSVPSTSTSISKTYENLQQLLSHASQGSESMDVSSSCSTGGASGTSGGAQAQFTNSDPLLDNIIQQAQELQQDMGSQSQPHSQQQQQQQMQQSAPSMDQTNMTDDVTLLSQLEQVLNSSNLSLTEIDNLLCINQAASQFNTSSDMSEQMAIDAIQQQLMRDDPMASTSSSVVSSTGPPQQQPQPDTTGLIPKSSANSLLMELNSSLDASAGIQRTSPMMQGQFQQQQQQQRAHMNFNQQQQQQQGGGPRFPQNLQVMPNGMQQQQQVRISPQQQQQQHPFASNTNPLSQANIVRHSLLMQQRQKQIREQKRLAQEHERLIIQQHQQQVNQYGGQSNFNQVQMDSSKNFPENFLDLMSCVAPNVSLQPNQGIPGPMSPMFNQNMNQMMGPPPPHSPSHLGQFGQPPPSQNQWSNRGGGMGSPMLQNQMMSQNSQFSNLQHQHSVPTSSMGSPVSPYSDSSHYSSSQNNGMNLFPGQPGQQSQQAPTQQGQQQFSQMSRQQMMQRQMSGGPGLSPVPQDWNKQKQGLGIGPNMPIGSQVMTSTSQNYMNSTSSMGQNFDQQMQFVNSVGQEFKPQVGVDANSTSQHVKRELRNKCNTRIQNQQQQQQDQFGFVTDELPMELICQIETLTREQQQQQQQQQQQHSQGLLGPMMGSPADPNQGCPPEINRVIEQSRQEAKTRYEKFRAMSAPMGNNQQDFSQLGMSFDDHEYPAVKASNLFRRQLLINSGHKDGKLQQQGGQNVGKKTPIKNLQKPDMPHVNIVQTEPRAPCEDIKPADHKNSLLQQLLSE